MRALGILRIGTLCALGAIAAGAGMGTAAYAQQERDALRRMQMQLQRVQQERAALEAKNAALTAQLAQAEATTKALDRAQKDLAASRREAAVARRVPQLEQQWREALDAQTQLRGERDAALAQVRTQTEQLQRTRATIEQLEAQAKQREAQARQREALLQARDQALDQCVANNRSLVTTGREILDTLSSGECAARRRWDPILQLGRVDFERDLEKYRDRVEDLGYLRSAESR